MHRSFPYYIQIKWKRLCLATGVIVTMGFYLALFLLLQAMNEYQSLHEWLGTLSGTELAILIVFSTAFTVLVIFANTFIAYNSPEVQFKMEMAADREANRMHPKSRDRRDRVVNQYDVN
jgi:hypothetical protein